MLRLLSEHEGPLTADFQRVYGLRLVDVITSRALSEIEDLIVWLPVESAFRASFVSKGKFDKAQRAWSWSQDKELLLGVVNLLAHQTYVIAQTNSPKRLKPPEKVSSPQGQEPKKRRDADSQARALLTAAKARKRAQ